MTSPQRGGHLLLSLLVLSASAAMARDGDPVTIGKRFQLRSDRIGEMRSFLVHTPPGYAWSKDAYPILIVLDGDELFAQASASVDSLAENERIPQMIVVGVPNTDRGRDLGAPGVSYEPPADGIGGPDKFLAFIGDELVPEIERRYRTRPYRVIAGHSAGGLSTLYTLISRPELFNAYVALSPAFNDEDGLADAVESFLAANDTLRADLFMAMANERGQNLGGAYEVASLLQEQGPSELRWQFRRYPEETHGSVVMRGLADGLQAVFDGWYMSDPFLVYEQGGLAAIEKHYAAVSTRLKYAVSPPQNRLLEVFFKLEVPLQPEEAEAVMARVLEIYPSSPYSHFYAARLYAQMRNEPRAIEHWTRTLELAPSFSGPRTWLAQRNVDVAAIVPEIDLPTGALAAYVGHYGPPNGGFEVIERGDTLYAKLPPREFILRPMSDTKMYFANGEDVLIFRKDNRGRVASVALQSTGVELQKLP